MSVSLTEAEVEVPAGSDDDLIHVVCESCHRQWCDGSLDLSPVAEWFESDDDCIVCDHLDPMETAPNRCPHCGSP